MRSRSIARSSRRSSGLARATSTSSSATRFEVELPQDATKLVANLPYNVATPLVVESLDGLPNVRLWCVMVQREVADRFFAAARNKGVRRRLGPRPARRRANRVPRGLPHRLPAAAERRLGARRLPADGASRGLRPREEGRHGRVRAPAQDAAELARARRARDARGRLPKRSPRSAIRAETRAEALAPAELVALARARCGEPSSGTGQGQPRARRRPAARRRQARGPDRAPADRPRRPHRARRRRRSSWSTASPATRLLARRSASSLGRGRSSRAGAVKIEKKIPVAAGLGGGSSDAATALRLANETLPEPLPAEDLHGVAAQIGADVPFFLADGPQLGSGDGSELEPLDLPQDFWVVVLLPHGKGKTSTADVYAAFDTRHGVEGFAERRRGAPRRARRGRAPARPRRSAAERPRELAARGGASRGGRLPCGRLRRRAGAVRALPSPPRRRRRETRAPPPRPAPGSRHLRGTVDAC